MKHWPQIAQLLGYGSLAVLITFTPVAAQNTAPTGVASNEGNPTPAAPAIGPDSTLPGILRLFDDDSETNTPHHGISFIGPCIRSGQAVTLDIFIVLVAPSSTVPGLEGLDVSYLQSKIRYDCERHTKQPLSITVVDESGRPTSVPIPVQFRNPTAVLPSSDDLSDKALPFACGQDSSTIAVSGIGEALNYARSRLNAPSVDLPAGSGPDNPSAQRSAGP